MANAENSLIIDLSQIVQWVKPVLMLVLGVALLVASQLARMLKKRRVKL